MKLTTKIWSLRCTIQTRMIEAHSRHRERRREREREERSIWHSFLISFIVSCFYLPLHCRGSTSISTHSQHHNGKNIHKKSNACPKVQQKQLHIGTFVLVLLLLYSRNKSTFRSKSKLHCSANWTVWMRKQATDVWNEWLKCKNWVLPAKLHFRTGIRWTFDGFLLMLSIYCSSRLLFLYGSHTKVLAQSSAVY